MGLHPTRPAAAGLSICAAEGRTRKDDGGCLAGEDQQGSEMNNLTTSVSQSVSYQDDRIVLGRWEDISFVVHIPIG